MEHSLWLIIPALLLLAMIAQPIFKENRQYRYKPKKYIMTRAEVDCYNKLLNIFGATSVIMCQVRLSSLLNEKVYGQNWRSAFLHISQKSVDFVLLDGKTLSVQAVIECDDPTHKRQDRSIRDNELDRIFLSVDIPFYHLTNTLHKTSEQIKKDIDKQKQNCYT